MILLHTFKTHPNQISNRVSRYNTQCIGKEYNNYQILFTTNKKLLPIVITVSEKDPSN